MDIITFMQSFQTEKECLDYLRAKRYKHFICPNCQGRKFWMIYSRKCMECAECNKQYCLTAHTIMHKSSTPLVKWFHAINLLTSSKKGMSALQLKGILKVTYKCAWRIAHKIREAMKDDDDDFFGGITQVDETYISGRQKGTFGRKMAKNKSIVVGALNLTDKKTRCQVISRATCDELLQFIKENISQGAEVHTDKWHAYKKLNTLGYTHKTIDHAKYFVKDGIHTNNLESFWGVLKRGIVGIYHQVSAKWLHNYLREFEFRYNNRANADRMFDLVLGNI